MQEYAKLFITFQILAVFCITPHLSEGTNPSLEAEKSEVTPSRISEYDPMISPLIYYDTDEDLIDDDVKRAEWNKLHGGWGKRAEWNKMSAAWGKRQPDGPGGNWNNLSGMWGKRATKWNGLSGMWGKRGWNDMSGAWGKREAPHWNKLRGMWGKRSVSDTESKLLSGKLQN